MRSNKMLMKQNNAGYTLVNELLVIAVIAYAILVLALQCITYEDCMLFPKGEKIAKILHIKHKT